MNIILERKDFFLGLNILFVFVNLALFFISGVMLNDVSLYSFTIVCVGLSLLFLTCFLKEGFFILDFNLVNMLFLSFNFYYFSLGILNVDNIKYRLVYFLFFIFLLIFSCFFCKMAKKNISPSFFIFSFNLVEINKNRRVLNLIDWNFKKNEFLIENKVKNKIILIICTFLGGCFFVYGFSDFNMHINIFYTFWAWFFSYVLSIFILFNIYKIYLSSLVYKGFFK